jgi:hypothetical protein
MAARVARQLEKANDFQVETAFHEKSGNSLFMSAVLSLRISVYLCVLCVKYVGANDLTQSTQSYTEIRRETKTANEPDFSCKAGRDRCRWARRVQCFHND